MVTLIVKRLTAISGCILFCLAAAQAAAQTEQESPVIESISVFAGSSEPEQVVFKLSGSHTPKIFRIEGERPRLVFDFQGIGYPAGVDKIPDVGGKIIAGVRVGMHANPLKTRVVVDIQKNSPYQYDSVFNVSNNHLVVSFLADFPDSGGSDAAAESGPRHIGFEQLKVVYGSAGDPEASASSQAEPAEPEPPEQQTEEPDRPVAVITADAAKRIVTPTRPEAVTEEAPPPAAAAATEPAAATDTPPSPEVAEPIGQEAAPAGTAAIDTAETVDSVLLDVSFEQSINMSETVLFRLNHFSPPLVFGIEKGEPRVVCDFLDTRLGESVPALIETGGDFINRITISAQDDPRKARVELILLPNRHYDLQQLFFKEDNLFVVIVKELPKEGAQTN